MNIELHNVSTVGVSVNEFVLRQQPLKWPYDNNSKHCSMKLFSS